MPTHGERSNQHKDEEWTYLTADLTEMPCAVCGQELRTGQAVGRIRDEIIHARCVGRSPEG